jgi:hypothetical protein
MSRPIFVDRGFRTQCFFWMMYSCILASAVVVGVPSLGVVQAQSPSAQADPLPEAPDKSLVVAKCTQCHGADQFAAMRQSGDGWDQTISKMQEKGLNLTDEDYEKILSYLTTNLGPPPVSINVNKATSSELQKALDLTDRETEAIIKARTAKGTFKDWQEVANVDGVDAKKIEAKKDLLVF